MLDESKNGDGMQDVRNFNGGMWAKLSSTGENFAHFGRRFKVHGSFISLYLHKINVPVKSKLHHPPPPGHTQGI